MGNVIPCSSKPNYVYWDSTLSFENFDWEWATPEIFNNRHRKCVRKSHEYRRLRGMQRQGMPKEIQLGFWKRTASAIKTDTNARLNTYKMLYNDMELEDYKQLTFGYADWKSEAYPKKDELAIKRVLLALAVLYTNVTYCPLLTCAVALFFSLGLEEAIVFDLCSSMIHASLSDKHGYYLRTNAVAFLKDVKIAMELIPKGLQDHAAIYDINLRSIITDWFMNFFKRILSNELRMRMFQIWAFEGYKVKFRIVAVLLRRYQRKLLRSKSTDSFDGTIRHCIRHDLDSLGIQPIINQILGLNMSRKKLASQFEELDNVLDVEVLINQLEDATRTFPDFENGDSTIISKRQLYKLWSELPKECRMYSIKREYVSSRHGYSLRSARDKVLMHPCQDYAGQLLIFLITQKKEVIGCFLNPPPRWKGEEFAATNTCVFSITPSLECYSFQDNLDDENLKPWCLWSREKFSVGGNDGPGFEFNSNLSDGMIHPNKYFCSSQLTSESAALYITDMEIWVMTLGVSDYYPIL